jgi:hypothetical protein
MALSRRGMAGALADANLDADICIKCKIARDEIKEFSDA